MRLAGGDHAQQGRDVGIGGAGEVRVRCERTGEGDSIELSFASGPPWGAVRPPDGGWLCRMYAVADGTVVGIGDLSSPSGTLSDVASLQEYRPAVAEVLRAAPAVGVEILLFASNR